MPTEKEAEYVNAREAARLLGVSQRAVRNLAGQQRLEVKTEGGGVAMRFMVSSWPPYEGSARSGNGKRTGAGAKKLASTHLVALRVGTDGEPPREAHRRRENGSLCVYRGGPGRRAHHLRARIHSPGRHEHDRHVGRGSFGFGDIRRPRPPCRFYMGARVLRLPVVGAAPKREGRILIGARPVGGAA